MKSIFEQNGRTYTQVGDYLIPDISLPDASAYPIGKYVLEGFPSSHNCLNCLYFPRLMTMKGKPSST